MRSRVRFTFVALLVGVIVAAAAPAAAQAAFGVEKLFAANCKAGFESCNSTGTETPEEEQAKAKLEGYTQAGGHPNFGVSDFTVTTTGTPPTAIPQGIVKHVRFDSGPGESTNPEAVTKCPTAQLGGGPLTAIGFFTAPTCNEEANQNNTRIGTNSVVVYVEGVGDVPLEGAVFNAEIPTGLSSLFVAALKLPKPITEGFIAKLEAEKVLPPLPAEVKEGQYYAHTLIEGHIEWATDYHDVYEINVAETLPLIRSRLVLFGNIGTGTAPFGSGGFLTNPTSCTGTGPQTTSTVTIESTTGQKGSKAYTTAIGNMNCGIVPFTPTFALSPSSTKSDAPDGITTTVGLPHDLSPITSPPNGLDSSQVKAATITLPEGLTLNPSAAHEVTEACKPSQIAIGTRNKVTCPAASKVGTVSLIVPGLPPSEPLEGNLYLGGPESGPITNPPYVLYVDAESPRYDISVRLKGTIEPNATTGRLTAKFGDTPGQPPEQPFSNLTMHFNGGPNGTLANPLACGPATTQASFEPYSAPGSSFGPAVSPFTVDSNGSGGACPSTLPFGPTQSTNNQTGSAGGNTSFTFTLARPEGNQYLSAVRTTLPAGLVGQIPKAAQCTEAQANAEPSQCPESSQIGTAVAVSGSGPTPYRFGNGRVYLTGPYQGAPFGLSVVVQAEAGPFNLGQVKTRAKLEIDPYTARVTTTATLPTIVKGIPIRLRELSVSINKQGFLLNPTSCNAMATESTVSSTFGATQNLSSSFQLNSCNALKFKPAFKAKSNARTSKANGAELETTLNEVPGNANVKSVKVQLPKQLPSRLTTLQKACPAATFEANPYHCPPGSFVGGARANTPTLTGKLKGPAILVSHAAAAFPDLDLVMEAEGVRAILVGNTDIKKGITTTTFASTPDVPVSSITVNLPIGPHSALAANGNLCASKLVMPTTMTGQNGTTTKQNTIIGVANCGVRVVGHKVVGSTAYVTVQTYAAGRVSAKGASVATTFRRLGSAQNAATLRVPLSRGGRSRRRPFNVKLRVGFVPRARGQRSSVAFVTVRFR